MADGVEKTGNNAPKGYTCIKLYDTRKKETVKTLYIPIGQKFSMNGMTYDPSKCKNNELVIKGTKGQDGFDLLGLALEHMDVNNDGRIDEYDNDGSYLAQKINKELQQKHSKYFVKDVPDVYSDAGISKGSGGVVFRDKNDPYCENGKYFEFRIDKE